MYIFSYTFIIVNLHINIAGLQSIRPKIYIDKSNYQCKNAYRFTFVKIQMQIQISANCEFLC